MYDIFTEDKNKDCSYEEKKKETKKNIEYLILCGVFVAIVVVSILLK
jgi:hypothetical protein